VSRFIPSPVKISKYQRKLDQTGAVRQFIVFGIVLIVLFCVVDICRLVSGRGAATSPEVRSGIAGYCLDDHHDGGGVNAAVDDWTCNGTAAQHWSVVGSAIKHDGTNDCLGVRSNGKAQGDTVVSNACNGSRGQAWTVDLGGYQNPNSGLCLAVPGNKTRTQLVVDSCNNLTQLNEAWAADTWTNTSNANIACSGTRGQKVACYAEKQWQAWESGSPSHKTLLSDYTDGNGYEEWCADFVSYVYREAGFPFAAGERDGWDEYDANNIQNMGFIMHQAGDYTPQPGDVAFFDYPGGHVEIVATGGRHPTFIYGDSGTVDPATGNGEMNEDNLTSDGAAGQVVYYLSPN
jgi:hypothetical protein